MSDESHMGEEIPACCSVSVDVGVDEGLDEGSVGGFERVEGSRFEVVEGGDGAVDVVGTEVGENKVGVGGVVGGEPS